MSNKKMSNSLVTATDSPEEDLLSIAKIIVEKLYGNQAGMLFDYLIRNEYVAEEKIANTLEFRSNEARKILQRLSDEAIVVLDRLKVEDEVLHVWRLNKHALKTFVLNRLKRAKEKLETLLKIEAENVIYECSTCKKRFLLDEAYAHGFQCPHDGDVLVELNNPTSLNTVKDVIRKINILVSKIERIKSA